MSGVKGRSGRQCNGPKGNRARAMQRMTNLLPAAIETIENTITGVNKDRLRYEAAVELKDSVQGKPRQQTDLDIKGGQEIGAGVVVQLFSLLQAKQKQLQSGAVPELPAGDIDKI